jgi:hypothetical protein
MNIRRSRVCRRGTKRTAAIFTPEGTRVRRGSLTNPSNQDDVNFGRCENGSVPEDRGDRAAGRPPADEERAYRVQLTDADGLRGGGETEYFIRLMDDRPPDVRILRPNGDQQVTPLEEVAIEARADDDYGIAEFDLVYSVAGRPERTATFSRVAGTNVAKIGLNCCRSRICACSRAT